MKPINETEKTAEHQATANSPTLAQAEINWMAENSPHLNFDLAKKQLGLNHTEESDGGEKC